MSQTTYSIEAAVAFEGMLADPSGGPSRRGVSLANEDAAALPFGRGVTYGTDKDKQFKLPTATGAKLAGVSVHRHGTQDVTDDGIAQDEPAELLREGRIWVIPEQDVSPTDPVYWRHTAGGAGEVPGRWRKDDDTAKADAVANAAWGSTATAGNPAILEVNLP